MLIFSWKSSTNSFSREKLFHSSEIMHYFPRKYKHSSRLFSLVGGAQFPFSTSFAYYLTCIHSGLDRIWMKRNKKNTIFCLLSRLIKMQGLTKNLKFDVWIYWNHFFSKIYLIFYPTVLQVHIHSNCPWPCTFFSKRLYISLPISNNFWIC